MKVFWNPNPKHYSLILRRPSLVPRPSSHRLAQAFDRLWYIKTEGILGVPPCILVVSRARLSRLLSESLACETSILATVIKELATRQAIKNWRPEWPGNRNEASCCVITLSHDMM